MLRAMRDPIVLDGKSLAKATEAELSRRVEAIKQRNGDRTPILATILVGSDPASATYVRMKGTACRRIGMDSLQVEMAEEATTEELLATIDELNAKPGRARHPATAPGPSADRRATLLRPNRDRQGRRRRDRAGVRADDDGRAGLRQCDASWGIVCLLDHHKIEIEGTHAVVIGRSPILGKPMAMMLLNRNATVTICHSRTRDLPEIVRSADILVAAVARPRFVKGDWIKPGAVIVDAGSHPEKCGDVDLDEAAPRSSAYTPVPGGVGTDDHLDADPTDRPRRGNAPPESTDAAPGDHDDDENRPTDRSEYPGRGVRGGTGARADHHHQRAG